MALGWLLVFCRCPAEPSVPCPVWIRCPDWIPCARRNPLGAKNIMMVEPCSNEPSSSALAKCVSTWNFVGPFPAQVHQDIDRMKADAATRTAVRSERLPADGLLRRFGF